VTRRWLGAMPEKPCLNCSTLFRPRRSSQKYCCRSCLTTHLRTIGKIKPRPRQGVTCTCLICECEFYVPAYRAATAKYCSRRCNARGNIEILEKGREKSPLMKRARAMAEENRGPRNYKRIVVNGEEVREHRWIMEQHLGRKLETWEHVHHIDGNHLNNSLSNLEVLSNADHQRKELEIWM